MTKEQRRNKTMIRNGVMLMEDKELMALNYDWMGKIGIARPEQKPPDMPWIVWLILAGRGFGKTRTGAEWIRYRVETKQAARIALVAPTAADGRDIMVEGESGILNVFPKSYRPIYEPSKRRLTFYTGATATVYSADEPERLRGPNNDTAWADELCSWRYPEAYDMLMLGLRLGDNPQCVVTTTPKPIKILKEIMKTPGTVITRGSTYDNAENLSKIFLSTIISKYEGTRLGRQELNAEILDDTPGALWTRAILDLHRVNEQPELDRIVIGVDPAVSTNEDSDETGIIVAGSKAIEGFILADYSGQLKPAAWAKRVVDAYYDHDADYVVAESNQGGDMVSFTIHTVDPNVPVKLIHASRGKQTRAEPISSLYEQGRVHHIGSIAVLEDQMTTWVPGAEDSPDRLDAMVHALTALLLGKQPAKRVKPTGITGTSSWD
jgi:phage terminase large subunit-like protein